MSLTKYTCTACKQLTTAPIDSLLALFQLCQPCQDARYARGIEAQRKAGSLQ